MEFVERWFDERKKKRVLINDAFQELDERSLKGNVHKRIEPSIDQRSSVLSSFDQFLFEQYFSSWCENWMKVGHAMNSRDRLQFNEIGSNNDEQKVVQTSVTSR